MKHTKIDFNTYFEGIYKDRWPILKNSLISHNSQVIRPVFSNSTLHYQDFLPFNNKTRETVFAINSKGLKENYVMDLASIISASSFPINKDDIVLDMCAAPGGKSLILFEKISGSGELWVNEISPNRRQKLKNVLREYIPEEKLSYLKVKGKDGIKYGLQYPEHFDKVLVDAPCSGEKHMLLNPKELATWNIKRTKRLAGIQYGLVCSALLSLKVDGQLLYSTCSISPLENDGVIEKLLNKKGEFIALDLPQLNFPNLEKTAFGYILLPDNSGAGPIYFSKLKKTNSTLSKVTKENL